MPLRRHNSDHDAIVYILGLDVSTSVVGVCVVDSNVEPGPTGSNVLLIDRVELAKAGSMWQKADAVAAYMESLTLRLERVVLEEPLVGFRQGLSSASTISTLVRFNGIVSYIARQRFNIEPEYIGSAHARKLCGIKLQRTSIAGASHKEQVFAHMAAHDLSHISWPTTRSGKVVGWSRDACDAYVIARAAAVINKQQ